MALSLSASQKNLRSLFINDDRYVIPSFQRPYSWTLREMKQLYDDITEAFDNDEDYFLGNIVIANSNKSASHPNIVDGQQRLLTLWLFIKILSFFSSNNRLKKMLEIEDEKGVAVSKIESDVFEKADQTQIDKIFSLDKKDFSRKNLPKEELMSSNLYQGFKWVEEYFNRLSKENQKDFVNYFINRIYLLPIELDGENMEEATNRALTIFATINNRGLDLSDADILKAKLYEMASIDNRNEEFRENWKLIGNKCRESNNEINDAFRLLLRILRAEKNLSTSEPNLRNFFLTDKESPFKTSSWTEIMSILNRIGDSMLYVDTLKYKSPQLALLMQILKSHPSYLPLSSLAIFIFKNIESIQYNEHEFQSQITEFIENLIRECYADTSIDLKYRVFEINACIMNNREWASSGMSYMELLSNANSRMRNGLVLLYHYLVEENLSSQEKCTEYIVQRIVYPSDSDAIKDWKSKFPNVELEDMANFSIIDFPKSYSSLSKRSVSYNQSQLSSVKSILNKKSYYSWLDFNARQNKMFETLSKFFKNI